MNFGYWLTIVRHDKNPNKVTCDFAEFHPCFTSVETIYKPVVHKLPNGKWEIVFVSELTEDLP